MQERAIFALGAGATGDPSLYIEPANVVHSFLVDCGNNHLGHARLLRTKFLFLSHTHLDHFIGFDSWMRVHLGGDSTLHIIGPAGVSEHVYHKIHGYVWNLAETVYLKFAVTELNPRRSFQLLPNERYRLEEIPASAPELDPRGDWTFQFQPLQHLSITSCGYRIYRPDQWRVNEEALVASGLRPGPWIKQMKSEQEGVIQVDGKDRSIAELRKQLLYFSRGYSITYITDAVYHPENIPRMVELAKDSDHFFCESSFLKEDVDRAARTHHLTTHQAASIAKEANAKLLHLFHFSRRYVNAEQQFLSEAREIFPNTVIGAAKQ